MEKTDKSAEEIDERLLVKRIWQRAYLDTEESHVMLIRDYAAHQLSEYKEYFELVEKAKQVLRDKGYGWTGLDILETCKLVPKAEPPEENQLAPPQESERP